MLRAVFLGHQSWLLSTDSTRVLVDPLLTDGFGHGGQAGRVFPERSVDLAALGPIDAVFLTHEHDDHFDIASLLRVDRRIPVLISARSSVAMADFLSAQGFTVRRIEPGSATRLGDVWLRTFVADHRAMPEADEWDALPFIMSDDASAGVFASSVDVSMPETMLEALSGMPGWPGLLCLANNTTDTRFVRRDAGTLSRSDDTDLLARVLGRRLAAVADRAGLPRFCAITGGGWRHPPELAWVDAVAFSVDPSRLARVLSDACGGVVRAVLPGEGVELRASGVRAASEPAITLRGSGDRPPIEPVQVPATLAPAVLPADKPEWIRLEACLETFARFLYARPVFAQVHSLPTSDALAFVLHSESAPAVFAYRPAAARFERVEHADPFSQFWSGFECWASDLLGLFEGRVGPSALCYSGRLRCWNRAADRLRISPHLLWLFSHPLHRPDVARVLYDNVAASCGAVSVEVQPQPNSARAITSF